MNISITELETLEDDKTCIRYVVDFEGTSVGCTFAPGVGYTEDSAKEYISSLYVNAG